MAGAGIGHGAGYRERMHALPVEPVQVDEPGVLAGLASHARARDHGGAFAQLGRELHTGVLQRFTGGDQRKLSEPVQQGGSVAVEIGRGVVPPHFGAVAEAQSGDVDRFDRADGRAAGAQGGPHLLPVPAQRAYDTHPGDGHPTSRHERSFRL